MKFPEDIEKLKTNILKTIHPICTADQNYVFQRTDAGRNLPQYYLIFFLFVDLLKFKWFGKHEKIAWSIPIEYKGKIFIIEYRKMGLGIFAKDAKKEEHEAEEIVKLIKKAIKKAEPYFLFIVQNALKKSEISVMNKSSWLYERYLYFLKEYKKKIKSLKKNKWDFSKEDQADWMALATIDSFYSWTEHIFVHLAILIGKIKTGKELTEFIEYNWMKKYKYVLGMSTKESKKFYDALIAIKRQLRNFYTHGAFGKNGEAFIFHSKTGAVPVQIIQKNRSNKYILTSFEYNDSDSIKIIESFIKFLWKDKLLPAKIYIESEFPTVLPYSSYGIYSNVMKSTEDMILFIDMLIHYRDIYANMDW